MREARERLELHESAVAAGVATVMVPGFAARRAARRRATGQARPGLTGAALEQAVDAFLAKVARPN